MPPEHPGGFSSPWAQAIIEDPLWEPVVTYSRVAHPSRGTENAFLAQSLNGPECVRAVLSFHRFPRSTSCPPAAASYAHHEARMIFSLGSGLDGHSGFAHGAVIGLLIDEVMGQCVATVFGRSIVTAELNVQFKKMLPTPSVVLCRAWIEEEPAGRKIRLKATVEDGEGGLFATGGGLFILVKPKTKM
jgi:acyl-coenzyme A thioesterase PaaI-like protein